MKNIAVFASGSGSNFEAIAQAVTRGELETNIACVICNKPEAGVLKKAEGFGIEAKVFQPRNYPDKAAYEIDILEHLNERLVDFIALAGYMRLIGPTLLDAFSGRIVNIHPSLLPAFPGLNAVGQAIEAGVKITGVTIHYVDEGMDTGTIIAQEAVRIEAADTVDTLSKKIHQVEHHLYPKTLANLHSHKRSVTYDD